MQPAKPIDTAAVSVRSGPNYRNEEWHRTLDAAKSREQRGDVAGARRLRSWARSMMCGARRER